MKKKGRMMFKNLAAVILAAGKGTRLNAKKINKVMYPLNGKPMIGYTVNLLKRAGIRTIIVVVGFRKNSVMDYLGPDFIYVEQKKRLGTAHALKCALPKIPLRIDNLFVCYSDDTAFYPPAVIRNLISCHLRSGNDLTLLTVRKDDPSGLGRIIRDHQGKIKRIVEEKDASQEEKGIKEINTGCYCFQRQFVKEYLPQIKKNFLKGEYYLTDIVSLGIKGKRKVTAVRIGRGEYFQGVNTKEQFLAAEAKMKKLAKQKAG